MSTVIAMFSGNILRHILVAVFAKIRLGGLVVRLVAVDAFALILGMPLDTWPGNNRSLDESAYA